MKRRGFGRGVVAAIVLAGLAFGAAAAVGALRYEEPQSYAAGSYPYPVVAADFNRDGRKDVAVGNEDDDNVTVLIGKGRKGKFKPPVEYPAGEYPFGVVAGPFTGGKALDLAVADYDGDTISVLRGNARGGFGAPVAYPVGDRPYYVAKGRLNRDRRPDLVVANNGSGDVSVLLGKADGTFRSQGRYSTGGGTYPVSVAIADVDRDGKRDVIALADADRFVVLKGRRNGTLRAPESFPGSTGTTYGMAVGDLNGDRRPDVIASSCELGGGVFVSVGKGRGSFKAPVHYDGGDCAYQLDLGDVDRDGKLDAIVTDEEGGDVDVLRGNGRGKLRSPITIPAGANYAYSVAAARLDRDRKLDFAVPSYAGESIQIVLSR